VIQSLPVHPSDRLVQQGRMYSEIPGPDKDGNDLADLYAKQARSLRLPEHPTFYAAPSIPYQLYHQGTPIEAHLLKTIKTINNVHNYAEWLTLTDTADLLQKHHKYNIGNLTHTFKHWAISGKNLFKAGAKDAARRAFHSKLFTNTLPLMPIRVRNQPHLYHGHSHGECPRCGCAEETISHLFSCQEAREGLTQIQANIDTTLRKWLPKTSKHTDQPSTLFGCFNIQSFFHNDTPIDPHLNQIHTDDFDAISPLELLRGLIPNGLKPLAKKNGMETDDIPKLLAELSDTILDSVYEYIWKPRCADTIAKTQTKKKTQRNRRDSSTTSKWQQIDADRCMMCG